MQGLWPFVSGLIRHGLTFGAGVLVARGVIDESMSQEVIAAAMTIVGVIWSMIDKNQRS